MKLLNVTFEESGKLLLLKADGTLEEIAEISEEKGFVVKAPAVFTGNIDVDQSDGGIRIHSNGNGTFPTWRLHAQDAYAWLHYWDNNGNIKTMVQFNPDGSVIFPKAPTHSDCANTVTTGNFMHSDEPSYITNSSQTAACCYIGNRTWHITLAGSLDVGALPSTAYTNYGIDLQAIATALGFANYDYGIPSSAQSGTYRIWDRTTGTEKTSLYGYYACLEQRKTAGGKKGYILCRQYKIDSGTGATGGWQLQVFPAKTFIRAEFYMKAW